MEETSPLKVKSLREIYESCDFVLIVQDPVTYEEAATKQEWQEAMPEEYAAIQKNNTWFLVDLP